jgi:hypothetical protein
LEGVTEAQLWAEGCEIIHVMDREADSYRLFEHLRQVGGDFIVRMRHDRCVEDGHLTEALYDAPIKLHRTVPLSARASKPMPNYTHRGRVAREAKLVVRCATVQFQPPKYLRESEPVELNVVQILEEEPPPGQEPISWVLATSLPVKTSAQVALVLDFYRARWLIEEFHKALKTGCMFEKRQLESFESIDSACDVLPHRLRAPAATLARTTQQRARVDGHAPVATPMPARAPESAAPTRKSHR